MNDKVSAKPRYQRKFVPLDPAAEVPPFRRNEQPQPRVVPLVSNAKRSHAVEKVRTGGKVVWKAVT